MFINFVICQKGVLSYERVTKCPKIYRKSALHLLKYNLVHEHNLCEFLVFLHHLKKHFVFRPGSEVINLQIGKEKDIFI